MMQKIATFLLALVAFLIPIEHRYDNLFRHYSKTLIPAGVAIEHFDRKIYFYASDLAILLLALIALFALRIPLRRFLFERGSLFLWILFGCAVASICVSPLFDYPVLYTRLLGLLSAILLFSYLANSEPRTNLIFSLIIGAALIQSAIAIAQYMHQTPLGLTLLSEPQIKTATFGMKSGHRWLLDSILGYDNPKNHIIRSCGTFIHSNVLGSFMALSMIGAYSLIAASGPWIRRLLGCSLIVQFFALSITYSRSALFGWALGTIAWFGLAIYHRGLRNVASDAALRFLAAMIALSIAISATLLFEQYLERGGVVNYNALNQGSDGIRIDAQKTALKIIRDKPLFGLGYQEFLIAAKNYLPPNQIPALPHNVFFLIGSETGLLSLAAYLCFLGVLFFRALRAPFTWRLASLLGIFIAFLFIGCCDFTPLQLQQGRLMFFCAAGLLAAESRLLQKEIAVARP